MDMEHSLCYMRQELTLPIASTETEPPGYNLHNIVNMYGAVCISGLITCSDCNWYAIPMVLLRFD